MDTYNSYNELAIANGCDPYIPMHLREDAWTDNMSPEFFRVPRYKGLYFGCGTSEDSAVGGTLEPPHVHVYGKKGAVAKLWLDDEKTGGVSVDPHKSKGVPAHELTGLIKHVMKNIDAAFDEWDNHAKKSNFLPKLNPKELVKFNEREKKRGNPPYVPAQQPKQSK